LISDPALGLLMLGLIVVVIMMGFPTAFTLMGLGMFFGFFAYYRTGQAWSDNHIFDLMVQRTYGAMTNDVLISIPLFVLMGYVMERGALVDKMFYSIQLAFRHVPASLAVATLIVCTFWGIASGLVGAVVVLMGVIAFNPMLKAGYDVRLASGVITAGGTLGILIPPSVMIIVYAAVAGQSVVKLYAAAMFPGFFLAFLYLVYIVGWAFLNPKIAPKLSESETRVPVRPWVGELQKSYSRKMLPALAAAAVTPARALRIMVDGVRLSYGTLLKNLGFALVPLALALVTVWGTWWYVVIHQQVDLQPAIAERVQTAGGPPAAGAEPAEEALQELGGATRQSSVTATENEPEALQQMGNAELRKQIVAAPAESGPREFYAFFAAAAAAFAFLLLYYYWRLEADQFEVLRLLVSSVMPLGILTVVVLTVILLGITTATESAAVGAAGAFLLAFQARTLDWKRTKEAVFLTAKTTSMVCWLFVGSALFSAVFAILGGQALLESCGVVPPANPSAVHDRVAGDHLPPWLAARVDRDYRDLRADLPAHAKALQHRSGAVGRSGFRQSTGGIPVAAGSDGGVLSEGCCSAACEPEPDILRHDALYVDRHRVHDIHVSMARHDALAAELSLRQLTPMTPLSVSPKSDGAHLITARPGVCTQPYRPRLVAGRGHQDHLRIAVSAPAAHVMVPPLVTRQSVLARRV
jgi:TRAP-type mannitol/chloroaromatic compound transport system permease large subunit